MVADAHTKRLREINLKKVDASTLMDLKLEDAKRVLTSMGPRYISRSDNEETTRGELEEKVADIAGDLIQCKGQVEFVDLFQVRTGTRRIP